VLFRLFSGFKKSESKLNGMAKEMTDIKTKESTVEKTVDSLKKSPETAIKKKDWGLIIAIIAFGILLLIIQFSRQLGIEGFP
jgi:hypothetical protein